jgi:hypothetical protein
VLAPDPDRGGALLDLYGVAQILAGMLGYVINTYAGMTAFTVIRMLP